MRHGLELELGSDWGEAHLERETAQRNAVRDAKDEGILVKYFKSHFSKSLSPENGDIHV